MAAVQTRAQEIARPDPSQGIQSRTPLAGSGGRKQGSGIEHGLVCIFSELEPCQSFPFRFKIGRPYVQPARRKCLFRYFYFMDRGFGLIHVKLQTWFPMQMQVYVNGHEWLARKLIAKIPRSRKWRATDRGRRVMAATLRLREASFHKLFQNASFS